MPETMGLMLYRNRRGVLLRLNSWTDRADAHTLHHDRVHTAAQQRAKFDADQGTELIDSIEPGSR